MPAQVLQAEGAGPGGEPLGKAEGGGDLSAPAGVEDGLVLASGGASDHERQAAEILQRFLGEATGSQPRISPKNGQKGILILKDLSTRTVSAKEAVTEKPIGEDGYRLTVTDRNVTLEGEGKGLVYGAVEFLKQYLDIDYWG